MASSIASLFGPTAEELMYSQQESMKQQQQQQLQQNLSMQSSPLAQQFYQSGYNIASGIGGMFGGAPMADPRLAQSIKSRQIMSDIGIEDLNDSGQLATLAQRFSEADMPEAALYFKDRQNALETQQKDYEVELAKATSKGALDIKDIASFNNVVQKVNEDTRNSLQSVRQARANLKLVIKGKNPTAQAALDNFLAKATGDSRLTEAEVKRVASAGGFPQRVVSSINQFITGTASEPTNEFKEDVLNAMEVIFNERYKEDKFRFTTQFATMIPVDYINAALPDINLSPAAEKYLNTKDTGEGGGSWGKGLRPKTTNAPSADTKSGNNRSVTMTGG